MAYLFLDLASTPSVKAAQVANGAGEFWANFVGHRDSDRLTDAEARFIQARDSFYLATISESGWPYVQHRGGPTGFLQVLDGRTLAFPDFRGNRQYISLGNLAADGRAALILMDYPNRRRLKMHGRIETKDLSTAPEIAAQLELPGYKAKVERAFLVRVEAFDWNCSQHITPRFSGTELERALTPAGARLAQLEAENRALRDRLAAYEVE